MRSGLRFQAVFFSEAGRAHAQRLLPQVDELVAGEHPLEAAAAGRLQGEVEQAVLAGLDDVVVEPVQARRPGGLERADPADVVRQVDLLLDGRQVREQDGQPPPAGVAFTCLRPRMRVTLRVTSWLRDADRRLPPARALPGPGAGVLRPRVRAGPATVRPCATRPRCKRRAPTRDAYFRARHG